MIFRLLLLLSWSAFLQTRLYSIDIIACTGRRKILVCTSWAEGWLCIFYGWSQHRSALSIHDLPPACTELRCCWTQRHGSGHSFRYFSRYMLFRQDPNIWTQCGSSGILKIGYYKDNDPGSHKCTNVQTFLLLQVDTLSAKLIALWWILVCTTSTVCLELQIHYWIPLLPICSEPCALQTSPWPL